MRHGTKIGVRFWPIQRRKRAHVVARIEPDLPNLRERRSTSEHATPIFGTPPNFGWFDLGLSTTDLIRITLFLLKA